MIRLVAKVFLLGLWSVLFCTSIAGQNDSLKQEDPFEITALSISFNDDFTSWDIYGVDDPPIGFLRLRWPHLTDWTEWSFRIGEVTGEIRRRVKNDPNIWELRSGNSVLTLKTIYHGDFNQWRITDDTRTLSFKTLYNNVYDGWKISNSRLGDFQVYTQWEMDPRDWIIYDKLDAAFDWKFKLAMAFLASYYSSPKY